MIFLGFGSQSLKLFTDLLTTSLVDITYVIYEISIYFEKVDLYEYLLSHHNLSVYLNYKTNLTEKLTVFG